MTLKVIAYAHNGHTDKFGIPRQSRDESPILTRIVFEPEYSIPEALRGIEGYSHLWLIWGFSEVQRTDVRCTKDVRGEEGTKEEMSWSPTVRPPRLGGNTRMGVFATRSPFRPNPIGLSSVRLVKAYSRQCSTDGHWQSDRAKPFTREGKGVSCELLVSGADVLDGTPIYDIKPYLSFSDSHEDAKNGFAEGAKDYKLDVVGLSSHLTCPLHNPYLPPTDIEKDILYILSQDPRPGYQDDPEREYKMDYAGWCVTFRVQNGTVIVEKLENRQKS